MNRRFVRLAGLVFVLAAAPATMAQQRELLWGDTHLHTSNSFDAFLNRNMSADPETAYRFAQGIPVVHPLHRARMQIGTPLDFLVVADHAEYLGVIRRVYFNGLPLENDGLIDKLKGWYAEWELRRLVDEREGSDLFVQLLPHKADPVTAAAAHQVGNGQEIPHAAELVQSTWNSATELADKYYQPGRFTTLIGWEWSSLPGGANLHRVVFTSADSEVARKFLPYGSDQSLYPEDLWAFLDRTSGETGAEFIAIPHNSNISKGFMFAETTLRGEAFTPEYAQTRIRWEPVVEATQIKGDSETHPAISPNDEFADFETYPYYIQQEREEYRPQEGDFVRGALKRGLRLEQKLGINPYRFGLIGSTDSHTGLSTAEENNFGGKLAIDGTPETKSPRNEHAVISGATGWSMSASGLAAVWAEDNTRESIMAAFKRREVYATTGPRIRLQVFGGFDFTAADLQQDLAQIGYARGVPMGGELKQSSDSAPTLLVVALKDPLEANLDRIQVVKGWVDAGGESHEQVYDVAWAGERQADADGHLPAVGNTVDLGTGKTADTIGAAQLSAAWSDPDFDPAQSAFYYVRVLQIPTARHTLLDALALKLDKPPEGALTIQERAYSSPIWYEPASR